MLEFIKNLFKKEEEPLEEVYVKLKELEDWLKQNSPESDEDIETGIKEQFEKISEIVFIAKKNLTLLENASLRNSKIPLKAKHMMQGNRDAYIKRTNLLLDSLLSNKTDFESAKIFYTNYSREIEDYNKSTARAYYVLQQFFANESQNIALNIKNIDKHANELNRLTNKNSINAIKNIIEKSSEIKEKLKIISEIDHDIKTNKLTEKEYSERIEKYNKKLGKTEESPGYLRLKKKLNEKKNILKEIKQRENELFSLFNNLEKALKKYSRDSLDEKLIIQYINNPVNAIIDDNKLKIHEILLKLKDALSNNTLDLKEDKKQRALKTIEELNKQYLINYKNNISEIKQQRVSCERSIMGDTAMQEYNELKYREEHFLSKIEKIKENIEKLEKLKEKNSVETLKKDIEQLSSNITNKDVKLILKDM